MSAPIFAPVSLWIKTEAVEAAIVVAVSIDPVIGADPECSPVNDPNTIELVAIEVFSNLNVAKSPSFIWAAVIALTSTLLPFTL